MKSPIIIKVFRVLFIGFIFISVSLFFFSNNKADPDLWGHLKFGQDIYEKRETPRCDSYSYSCYGASWIDHEWLSELIFFIIFRFTKGAGLIFFKVFVGLIITLLIFSSVSNQTKSTFLKLLFILISLSVIDYGFYTRPQIFTYLFFTIFIFSIDRFEDTRKPHWLYAFPFIALAWCNLHGGFIVGIGVLVLYFLFKVFQKKATKELAIITALTVLATFLNPYGKELWAFLLGSLAEPRDYIYEWIPVRFSFVFLDYFGISFLVIIGILFSKIKRSAYEITILFIAFLYSFRQNRHIVLFAILAAIYIPKYIDSFTKNWFINIEKRFSRSSIIVILLCFSLFFFSTALYKGKINPFKIEIIENIYPVNAIKFMKDNKIEGNIFVFFNWAEMCIRELSDTSKVFFDGRYKTVYSNDFIRDYFDILHVKKNYKDYLNQFPETDIMLLHSFNPLTHRLVRDREWILIYSYPLAWIFLKDNKKNSQIIENFKNNGLIHDRIGPPFYFE